MQFHKRIGDFLSSDGVHRIRYYVYTPLEGEVRAVLQISHGMCEYVERYEPFAAYLCAHGIAVAGNDHLGHGTAAQEAGTLGWFGEQEGYRFLPADLQQLTLLLREEFPGRPCFLLGHSMGSFVARLYLTEYGGLLSGAILMGTSGPNPASGIGIRVAGLLARLHGSRAYSHLLDRLTTGNYSKRFAAEHDPNSWLSKDVQTRNRYADDPLCTFRFTIGGHRDLITMLHAVTGAKWAARVPKDLPILLTSGREDPVGQYGRGVEKVYRQLCRAGVRDVTLRLYENDRHEILNETDREQVYADILHYLEEKRDWIVVEERPSISTEKP